MSLLITLKPQFPFSSPPPHKAISKTLINPHFKPIKSCLSNQEIDMVKTKTGTYAPKTKKVVILWDLDNKPPRGPPYEAALSLKTLATTFGHVIDFSAYANRHAFIHLPQWVVSQRHETRKLEYLERKGLSTPSDPYICSVCGRKCRTQLDLKKHFKQLHERERNKKIGRMRSLKGKKRQRFKERFIDGNEKYNEAARELLTPKEGYGLERELRRAGVYVKTVKDRPQAADWALKRQMLHSMSRGVDWVVLVSDDSDFVDVLRKAREGNLGTVVVGDRDRALGRVADVWVEWERVENGEVKESDLVLKTRREEEESEGEFTVSEFGGGEVSLDDIVGGIGFQCSRVSSMFSEGEDDEDDEGGDYFLDSDDDEYLEGDDDVYF